MIHLAIALLLVVSVASAGEATDYRLMACRSPREGIKLVAGRGGVQDLYYFSQGRWVNVTRFEHRETIFDYGVSPDGRYLFAWHMDVSPRKVSVYDLQPGGKRIGRFEPGFGGDLCWNARNQIVHRFGCGSICMGSKVYGRQGQVLFELIGPVAAVSPSGRYLATFPVGWSFPRDIAIYDLHDTEEGSLLIATKPILTVGAVGEVSNIDWLQEQDVTFHYVAEDDAAAARPMHVTLDLRSRDLRR